MSKPYNLIEFKNDELMDGFIDDLINGDIAYEVLDEFKYGKIVKYIARSNSSGEEMEFCSYIKEEVLQNLVNSRSYLLR